MKKILFAMASIVVAGMVNAAAFTWSTNISSSMGPLYVAGGSTTLASGTAYLFDSLALSQQDVLDAFVAGSLEMVQQHLARFSLLLMKIRYLFLTSFQRPVLLLAQRDSHLRQQRLLSLKSWMPGMDTALLVGIRPFRSRRADCSCSSAWLASRFAAVAPNPPLPFGSTEGE